MGAKDIVKLDDYWTDVPRPSWGTRARAHPPHQSPRADSWEKSMETNNYKFLPCPNQFTVKESFLEQKRDLTDVFIRSQEDNNVGLSCEDHKLLDIIETGVHKNEQGNWEMPLPFRRKDRHLPNKWSQAVNRLNRLIRTLKRKPQMAKDYVEFMGKIIQKGHASPVPIEEITKP